MDSDGLHSLILANVPSVTGLILLLPFFFFLHSIEVAAKIADVLNVTVDYLLTGSGSMMDKKMMPRLQLLEQLEDEDRDALLKVVDNYLTTAQLQSTSKKLKKA